MEPVGKTLSEHASKQLLAQYGVPVARETFVLSPDGAERAASEIGFPVVLKLCGDGIAHKTERDLVRLNLGDTGCRAIGRGRGAAGSRVARRTERSELLVAEMVRGSRELIAGLVRDPQLGRLRDARPGWHS